MFAMIHELLPVIINGKASSYEYVSEKPLAVLLSLALTFPVLPAAQAAVEDALPEIGTTAGGTLSIGQENLMGTFICG